MNIGIVDEQQVDLIKDIGDPYDDFNLKPQEISPQNKLFYHSLINTSLHT